MSNDKYGTCNKCQTKWIKLYSYNDRWLCKDNLCYQEEVEKGSGKQERDLENLEKYRQLVAGTHDIPATTYPE